MIAFTAIWLLLGLIAIIVLLILSIIKKVKWRYLGLSLAVYLFFSFIFLIMAGSPSTIRNANSQSANKRTFSIVSNKDDRVDGDLMFDTNEDGNYTLKLKGLEDGPVTIRNSENDKVIKTIDVHKGKIAKAKIHVPKSKDEYELVATDGNEHSKDFTIMNDSDAHLSIDSDSSSTTEYPSLKSNKEVASAINDDFSNSGVGLLENTRVKYKDSIFYVSVPDDVATSTDNEQKVFYEKIARTIHSYQKNPTGVIYFEDQQGNIVATTKALNNNEIKLK